MKKNLEFCFSFLWQEHFHSKILGAWLCVYVSITALFWQKVYFQSVNNNTRVGCERCSRLIKQNASKTNVNCCSTLVRFEQTLHLAWVLLWLLPKKQVNVQCGNDSIPMLISSHIHNAAIRAIAKNSWQGCFEKFEVLCSRKQ